MNSHNQSPPLELEGINYGDRLPITWDVLPSLPSEGESHRLNRTNEELLQHLLLLDEASLDAEEEESGGQEQFKRLEAKLDTLLSLVSEMMAANSGLPGRRAMRVGARGLYVHAQPSEMATLQEGAILQIHLYLNPQFPRPLDICGHVTSLQSDGFIVTYAPLEDELQGLLDKYVFRQHRRAVALTRRHPSP